MSHRRHHHRERKPQESAQPHPSYPHIDPGRGGPVIPATSKHYVAGSTQQTESDLLNVENSSIVKTPPAGLPARVISPGVYEVEHRSMEGNLNFSKGDTKPVFGHQHDESYNQQKSQWMFEPMGDGWSIAIVDSNSYLTIGGGPKHGIPIVASEYPVAWKVENHNNGAFRISWPSTLFHWSPVSGSSGTHIQLSGIAAQNYPDHTSWRLKYVGNLPSTNLDSRLETLPEAGQSAEDLSDSSTSSSDTDNFYLIVKRVVKTKSKPRKSKRPPSSDSEMDGSSPIFKPTTEAEARRVRRSGDGASSISV